MKGADATLDCNASAAVGLRLDDGATLRFETNTALLVFAKSLSFAAGTNFIAFAGGVAPTNGMVLARWPNGGSIPAGDFVFADSSLAARWVLSKTATGLVVENAPLPAEVDAAITVRRYGDSGWEDVTLHYDLPTQWVTNYYPQIDTPEAVAAKYDDVAANGAEVWQCYALGLDPTDAESRVSLSMLARDGKLRFAVEGLGETHEISGVTVWWSLRTATDLASGQGFPYTRESTTGLSPTFAEHDIPDSPWSGSSEKADRLFYKLVVTFVAD